MHIFFWFLMIILVCGIAVLLLSIRDLKSSNIDRSSGGAYGIFFSFAIIGLDGIGWLFYWFIPKMVGM